MSTVFMFCAVVGGTVFVVQFVLAIIGFGADDLDFAADIPDDIDVADAQGEVHGHGSTWMFGVISFRTVIAAITFFGLAGLGALEANQLPVVSFGAALMAGLAAMYVVHYIMRFLFRLKHDGTVRIERSVGQRAKVYVPIPGKNAGSGKVQLKLQDRIMEYAAVTPSKEKLPTGTLVEVVRVAGPSTLEVKAVSEPA